MCGAPCCHRVSSKLSLNQTLWHMRNHYEGTWLDPTKDVGGGAFHSPYRLGLGRTWEYGGETYLNERSIGVEYAAMNIACVGRRTHRYGIVWWGADDSSFSLHAPLYGVTSRLPRSHDGGDCMGRVACREALGLPGSIAHFSLETMHWVRVLPCSYHATLFF